MTASPTDAGATFVPISQTPAYEWLKERRRRVAAETKRDAHLVMIEGILRQAIDKAKATTEWKEGYVDSGEAYSAYRSTPIDYPHSHISKRTFSTWLKELEKEGIIEIHLVAQGRKGTTSVFRFKEW